MEARVCIIVFKQSNSLIDAEKGEIAALEILCLCFKKLKGVSVCCNCAVNAGKREWPWP